uniref:BTB domain-containing protein n=1 Tax=Panagrellus redivivus TaxID=6233 RepID=A0A7E4W3I9_PANRE
MADIKVVAPARDVITFTLNEADLVSREQPETPKHQIPYSDNLTWYVDWCAGGWNARDNGYVSVFINVNKPVKAKYSFAIDGSSFKRERTQEFTEPKYYGGWQKYQSHEDLHPLFRNGKLTITCNVEFELPMSYTCLKPNLFDSCGHFPTDLELVTSSGSVSAHKSLLMLMSPVFHAMFTHDTAESKSGKVKITDIDFQTVKAAVDFCYGREMVNKSINTIISILRFADKYDIKAVNAQLEQIPSLNLSTETFCAIVHYAFDLSKFELLNQCCVFFQKNQNAIKDLDTFVKLPQPVVVYLLKTAFLLETDLDVLRHCHNNKIDFVVDPLEQPFLDSLTIDDYCAVTSYAWDCSRDSLKNACASFLNDNTQVIKLKAFHDISPQTMSELIKLGYDLANSV